MRLLIKNLIFTVLVPGTVVVYIPYRIIKDQYNSFAIHWNMLHISSVFVIVTGTSIYFYCLWDFAVTGRGTPAPIDAPKHLVIKGLYSYVRNPMYIGVLLALLGCSALYDSLTMLQYTLLMGIIFHAAVIVMEEPILQRKYGESYKIYCKAVRRWTPGKGCKKTSS